MSFQAQSMKQKCTNPEGYQLFVGMTHDLDFGLLVRNHWFLRNGVSKFNTIRSSEVYENLERFDFLLSFIVVVFSLLRILCVHTKEGYNKNFLAWIFVSDIGFPWVSSLKKEQQKIELEFIYYTHRLIWTIYDLEKRWHENFFNTVIQ